LRGVIEVIQIARVLVRPINLGGSTYPTEPGVFWFPETPELAPEAHRSVLTRLGLRRGQPESVPDDDAEDDGKFAPMPYGMIFVPSSSQEEEPDARDDVQLS
jgi:hypothetical protein